MAASKVATWALMDGGAKVAPVPTALATPIWNTPPWCKPSTDIKAPTESVRCEPAIEILPPEPFSPSASITP